jgi:hypothetical protein
VPRKNLWDRLEEINVSFRLRDSTISLYKNVMPNFKNIQGWSKEINAILDSSKVVPYPLPFLAYILTS